MNVKAKQSYKNQIRTRIKINLRSKVPNKLLSLPLPLPLPLQTSQSTSISCSSSSEITLVPTSRAAQSKTSHAKSGKSMLHALMWYPQAAPNQTRSNSNAPNQNTAYEKTRTRIRARSNTHRLPLFVLTLIIIVECFSFGICENIKIKSDDFPLLPNAVETINLKPKDMWRNNASSIMSQPAHLEHTRSRIARSPNDELQILGYHLVSSESEVKEDDGIISVLKDSEFTIRIFGIGITQNTVITFTAQPNSFGGKCQLPATLLYKPEPGSATNNTALYRMALPLIDKTITNGSSSFYICAKNDPLTNSDRAMETKPLVHQGSHKWLQMRSYDLFLPLWLQYIIIVVCLCFSALFSGLNLGLMSLDRTELKILRNTGSPKERNYARQIQPVRDRGNFLLCSILLGNVLVNNTFTILLDSLTSGLIAVVFSTILIVIFGEITPQAICSRHGLAVGAKTIYITKMVMWLTSPLSYPISKILDYILGEEIGNVYNRERLKELVKVTTGINDLDKNEVNIISGALELRKKTVADVMTHIDDAFMLSLEAVLDFATVSEIMKSGYSRIPVYDGDKKNIVTLLYIKDLAFVDTDDNTPLRTLCEFYQNPVHFVFEDMTLDLMFNQFKDGTIGHIAFVHRVNNEGDGDPFYETIGLVTLEDVIEELIQAEIVDETDVYIDNRTKVRRHRSKKQDFSAFAERRENQKIRISPQLTLATYQYLSTSVDAFKKEIVSETILRRLLNQDIIHNIKCKGKSKDDPRLYIFQQAKAVDFFVLILEGRVEVTVGKENLLFEAGPFTYFGTQALVPNVVVETSSSMLRGSIQSLNMDSKLRQTFIPDYSVRAVTDVIYIVIKRSLYLTAKKATLLEKTRKSGIEPGSEITDDEVEKLLHSVTEDEIRATHNSRKRSIVQGSNTASPSLNDISLQSHSNVAPQHNSQSSSSGEVLEVASLSSQITSDPVNDAAEQNGERENIATTPLLPKQPENNTDK